MEQQVQIVGIAWYTLENYSALKAMMEDGDKLPPTYSQWRMSAEPLEKKLRREGKLVVRAHLDPVTFGEWCRVRGLHIDANARMQFANQAAIDKHRQSD